jgi:predicted O-methyltransferase YrrM
MNNEFPNWFASTEAKVNFEKFLAPYKGHTELQFLQLGAYTGDASLWLLQNILTDKSSHLTDVDTWKGSNEDEHHKLDFKAVENVYNYQTRGYKNLTKFKGTTIEWLKAAPFDYYDFIYVDADHTAPAVLIDAELSWLSLKPGGLLAFDDYEWNLGRGDVYNPKPGIDTFMYRHKAELKVLHIGWQVWVAKK